MKRVVCLLLIILVILNLTGCAKTIGERYEIKDLIFTEVVGVDKISGDNEKVRVSITSAKSSLGSEKQGQTTSIQYIVYTADGDSLFEAIRRCNRYADSRISFKHLKFIIVGEDTAKDDIIKYINLLMRDSNVRLNVKVLVAKGQTAESIIKNKIFSSKNVQDKLEAASNNIGNTSVSGEVETLDLINMIDSEYSSAYVPCIKMIKNIRFENNQKHDDISLSGYALFKGKSLCDYAVEDEARGFNWVLGKFGSGVLIVKDLNNKKVSVEVNSSETEIIPKIKNNKLSVSIKINAVFNIGEHEFAGDIYKTDSLKYLTMQQEEEIKSQVGKIIDKAKKHQIDIFGIGDKVFHKYPVQWQDMKNKWQDEIFPNLDIQIDVNTRMGTTYNIKQVL